MTQSFSSDDAFAQTLAELSTTGITPDDKYSLQVEHRQGVLILRVSGFLLQPIPTEFSHRFEALLLSHQITRVMIDLSRCTYMSSAVMGYLVKYFELVHEEKDKRIVMVQPPDKVTKVLQIIGLDKFFVFHASEQAALDALLN